MDGSRVYRPRRPWRANWGDLEGVHENGRRDAMRCVGQLLS